MTPWRSFLIAFVVGLTWGLFGAYAFAPPPATPLEGARVALVAALPFGAGRVAPDACVDPGAGAMIRSQQAARTPASAETSSL